MPSITMCATECPDAAECYRSPSSGTEPNWRQSWSAFHFDMTDDGQVVCQHFMPLWDKSLASQPADQTRQGERTNG